MKMKEIMDTIASLAQSQGFYGRLLRSIRECQQNDPDAYARLTNELEAQNFRDPVDLILYIEG